jgi:hypothetical protein
MHATQDSRCFNRQHIFLTSRAYRKPFKILWHFTRCRINSRGLMGLNFEWKSYTWQIQARNS